MKIVVNHPDKIESILFLLRRDGFKNAAYDLLKKSIKAELELSRLSLLFTTVNGIYRKTALERPRS
jgi:hypothetical protein